MPPFKIDGQLILISLQLISATARTTLRLLTYADNSNIPNKRERGGERKRAREREKRERDREIEREREREKERERRERERERYNTVTSSAIRTQLFHFLCNNNETF